MSFCDVKNETEAFKKALDIITYFKTQSGMQKRAREVANRAVLYDKQQLADYYFRESVVNRYFKFRFVYFKKAKVFGCVGDFPDWFPVTISFQDSTDQDYDFSVWAGIKPFEKIATKCSKMSVDGIFLENVFPDLAKEEISLNINYWRRSLAYKKICKILNLKEWMEHDAQNVSNQYFDSFSMTALDDEMLVSTAQTQLKVALIEMNSELKEILIK